MSIVTPLNTDPNGNPIQTHQIERLYPAQKFNKMRRARAKKRSSTALDLDYSSYPIPLLQRQTCE